MRTHVFSMLLVLSIATMPVPTHAVTTQELLDQIDALLKIVLNLQQQIQALSSGTIQDSTPMPSINLADPASTGITSFLRPADYDVCVRPITRSLSLGDDGEDVLALQEFLKDQGHYTGELGGFLGQLTQTAVQRYQTAHGIVSTGTAATTGYGVVGPKTRSVIAAFCAQPLANEPKPLLTSPAPTQSPTCSVVPTLPQNFCGTEYAPEAVYGNDTCQTGWICKKLSTIITTPTIPSSNTNVVCTSEYVPVCARMPAVDTPFTFSNNCFMQQAQATLVSNGVCPTTATPSDTAANHAPIIDSVAGPADIALNQTGTWIITAHDEDTTDTLQYKMTWGDENVSSINAITTLANSNTFSTTRSFTHFYTLSSVYTIVATVRDAAGLTATKSLQVRVGGGSGKCYSNITLYPEGTTKTCITKDGGGGTTCAPTNYTYICRSNEWVLQQTTN